MTTKFEKMHPDKATLNYLHSEFRSGVTTEQRLLLNLSTIIQYNKNPKYISVDIPSQEEAVKIFNELGFEGALNKLLELGWADYAGEDE